MFSADLLLPIKKKGRPPKLRSTEELYTAVAVVGDQFWNKGRTREFCLASALEEGFMTMDGTFHNLDHASRIEDVIGTHINTRYEIDNKRMIIQIKPNREMPAYQVWKAFLDMCKESGNIPNVSIEALVTVEDIPAKELPEGIDYKQFGIEDDEMVEVEKGYNFVGAATVRAGACNEDDGCGITLNNCNCEAEFSVEHKEEKEMVEEKKEPETTEEPEIKEPKVEDKSEVVTALKEKLVNCGEQRKLIEQSNIDLTSEKEALEHRIIALEDEVKFAEDKLNVPVTKKQTTEQKQKSNGVMAIEELMRGGK